LQQGQKVSRDDEEDDYYKLAKEKPDPEDRLSLDVNVSNPSNAINTMDDEDDEVDFSNEYERS
jgi:hypothetical protein